MQARGWRGLLAGFIIGSVAVAGGCGSGDSGNQIGISTEQQGIEKRTGRRFWNRRNRR